MSRPLPLDMPAASRAARLSRHVAIILTVGSALFVFILALELLKGGASGMAGFLRGLRVAGFSNNLGFGWLMAYLLLSGSPVAAIAVTLFAGGTLTAVETFGLINGSRFGASFIVLFTGFIYYLRGIRGRGVVTMGVLSMVTTATIYLPAMVLGLLVLRQNWLAGVRLEMPLPIASLLDLIYDPITGAARAALPAVVVFAAGVGLLLLSFRLFDRALPSMDSNLLQSRWGRWMNKPQLMFALGLLVTSITLSVSVSLSILVPLAGRGYIRRDQVVPYIMGANISTFGDTLFASLLVGNPTAFTIVLTEIVAVAAVSLLVLLTAYRPYEAALLGFNRFVAADRRRFIAFVGMLALVPLTLLLL